MAIDRQLFITIGGKVEVRRWCTTDDDQEYGHDIVVVLGQGLDQRIEVNNGRMERHNLARDLEEVADFLRRM